MKLTTFPKHLTSSLALLFGAFLSHSLAVEQQDDAEVRPYNRHGNKITDPTYAKWRQYVASKLKEEQVWLHTLEEQLGSYYFPKFVNDILTIEPEGMRENDPWAYVKDDPQLPRVLILGDSISRSYTATVRKHLHGKANVHRAPANCGPTDKFFQHGETWLLQNGSDEWDLITVNFGIHDSGNVPEKFAANLMKIIGRLKQTGAKVLWVRTTPWSGKEDSKEVDLSIPLNAVSDAVARKEGLEIIDLHAPMAAGRDQMQFSDNCHFDEAGAERMGEIIAKAIKKHY